MPAVAGAAARVPVRLEDDRGQPRRLQPQRGGHAGHPAADHGHIGTAAGEAVGPSAGALLAATVRVTARVLNVCSEHAFRMERFLLRVNGSGVCEETPGNRSRRDCVPLYDHRSRTGYRGGGDGDGRQVGWTKRWLAAEGRRLGGRCGGAARRLRRGGVGTGGRARGQGVGVADAFRFRERAGVGGRRKAVGDTVRDALRGGP